MSYFGFLPLLVCSGLLSAQVTRPKDVRELAKGGSNAIPQLQALLKNQDLNIRVEAVKSIVDIGTQRSLDPSAEAGLLDPGKGMRIRGELLDLVRDLVEHEA